MGTSTSGGLPIRLVRRDGDPLYLHCTDYTFGLNRAVPAIPVPVLGERIGADLNLVMADIRLNCILTDDDCSGTTQAASAASGYIDFSTLGAFTATGEEDAVDTLMSGDAGEVTIADLNGKSFSIRTTHQANTGAAAIKVEFDTSILPVNSVAATNVLTAGLNGVASTGAALATALEAAFTGHGGAFAPAITSTGGTSFGSAFTVVQNGADSGPPEDFCFNPHLGNCRIILTQAEIGAAGNSATPFFWTDDAEEHPASPEVQTFGNGTNTHSCRSAADKMQDLIANVANSNVGGGGVGSAFNIMGGKTDRGGWDSDVSLNLRGSADDYIVGLQIPYNSLLHAPVDASLLPNGYGTRNFMIVTGLTSPDAQNALGNANPASVKFDSRDSSTGIRGTVTQCNFTYNASETTYAAEITFQPIDKIFGP